MRYTVCGSIHRGGTGVGVVCVWFALFQATCASAWTVSSAPLRLRWGFSLKFCASDRRLAVNLVQIGLENQCFLTDTCNSHCLHSLLRVHVVDCLVQSEVVGKMKGKERPNVQSYVHASCVMPVGAKTATGCGKQTSRGACINTLPQPGPPSSLSENEPSVTMSVRNWRTDVDNDWVSRIL